MEKCGEEKEERSWEIVQEDNSDYLSLQERMQGMEDPFSPSWNQIKQEFKQRSFFNRFSSYGNFIIISICKVKLCLLDLRAYIIKGNDDLRQELMAIQIFYKVKQIFDQAQIPIYFRPYQIIITSENSGILGTLFIANNYF